MKNIHSIGKKIYRLGYWPEFRRYINFYVRALLNPGRMDKIDAYFKQDDERQKIAAAFPYVYEMVQRAFFYHRSTFDERISVVCSHFDALFAVLKADAVCGMYNDGQIVLWETGFEEKPLQIILHFSPGQRKEGLLATTLMHGGRLLYQIIFWLGTAPEICVGDGRKHTENNGISNNGINFYIGALQGPNGEEPKEIIKRLTKFCHGSRTKNLILHAAQEIARALDAKHIFAVTNEGYYANNHIRIDRKLKTSFSDFWLEAGGKALPDARFFELPLTEARKAPEEIPTRKRAVYRRRFALLDEIDKSIIKALGQIKK